MCVRSQVDCREMVVSPAPQIARFFLVCICLLSLTSRFLCARVCFGFRGRNTFRRYHLLLYVCVNATDCRQSVTFCGWCRAVPRGVLGRANGGAQEGEEGAVRLLGALRRRLRVSIQGRKTKPPALPSVGLPINRSNTDIRQKERVYCEDNTHLSCITHADGR